MKRGLALGALALALLLAGCGPATQLGRQIQDGVERLLAEQETIVVLDSQTGVTWWARLDAEGELHVLWYPDTEEELKQTMDEAEREALYQEACDTVPKSIDQSMRALKRLLREPSIYLDDIETVESTEQQWYSASVSYDEDAILRKWGVLPTLGVVYDEEMRFQMVTLLIFDFQEDRTQVFFGVGK